MYKSHGTQYPEKVKVWVLYVIVIATVSVVVMSIFNPATYLVCKVFVGKYMAFVDTQTNSPEVCLGGLVQALWAVDFLTTRQAQNFASETQEIQRKKMTKIASKGGIDKYHSDFYSSSPTVFSPET